MDRLYQPGARSRCFSDVPEPLPIGNTDDMRAGVDQASLPKSFQGGIHRRSRRPDGVSELLLRDTQLLREAVGTGFP